MGEEVVPEGHVSLESDLRNALKITEVRTWLVEGVVYNWTLIKIYTDVGLTGIGEATNWPGSPMVASACEFVGQYLIGQDASRIDYIWTELYKDFHWLGQAGVLMSAISAVDIALWDIAGKDREDASLPASWRCLPRHY